MEPITVASLALCDLTINHTLPVVAFRDQTSSVDFAALRIVSQLWLDVDAACEGSLNRTTHHLLRIIVIITTHLV